MPSDYEKAEMSRLKGEIAQLHKEVNMWRSKAEMRSNMINHLQSVLQFISLTAQAELK